jgi:ubiquinone/menaquinone biosynthesis C-methylase UbiE
LKLNAIERWLVNNPARALVQRVYEVPLLSKLDGRIEGGRLLEAGCGRGVSLRMILRDFGAQHVTGIDFDPSQLMRAKRRLGSRYAGRIDLGVASVVQLPFQDGSFDAVFDFGMLHHVAVWQEGVAEISRVLKPGGTFFFEEVTRAALERWSYRTFL